MLAVGYHQPPHDVHGHPVVHAVGQPLAVALRDAAVVAEQRSDELLGLWASPIGAARVAPRGRYRHLVRSVVDHQTPPSGGNSCGGVARRDQYSGTVDLLAEGQGRWTPYERPCARKWRAAE